MANVPSPPPGEATGGDASVESSLLYGFEALASPRSGSLTLIVGAWSADLATITQTLAMRIKIRDRGLGTIFGDAASRKLLRGSGSCGGATNGSSDKGKDDDEGDDANLVGEVELLADDELRYWARGTAPISAIGGGSGGGGGDSSTEADGRKEDVRCSEETSWAKSLVFGRQRSVFLHANRLGRASLAVLLQDIANDVTLVLVAHSVSDVPLTLRASVVRLYATAVTHKKARADLVEYLGDEIGTDALAATDSERCAVVRRDLPGRKQAWWVPNSFVEFMRGKLARATLVHGARAAAHCRSRP